MSIAMFVKAFIFIAKVSWRAAKFAHELLEDMQELKAHTYERILTTAQQTLVDGECTTPAGGQAEDGARKVCTPR